MIRVALACLLCCASLLPLAAGASEAAPEVIVVTGSRDAEWASYRHAYRAAAKFARYTPSRPLIQAHMQVQPLREGLPMEGIQVHILGEKTSIHLAADLAGRVSVPLLKEPFDEDAVMRLNRHKGNYRFSGLFTIRERDDGRYSAADLRTACEQMLSAQREAGNRFILMGKRCAGVRFIYTLGDAAASLAFHGADGSEAAIASAEERGFDLPRIVTRHKVWTVRFADLPAEGTLHVATRPLSIVALYQ